VETGPGARPGSAGAAPGDGEDVHLAVIDRVEAGEHVTVTRDGRPVAELRPLRQRGLSAVALLERWRRMAYPRWTRV
jgi:antitoxin (DNA-binding transcriptional repressor) of toxin-antitoxin stability system